jgi:hypothetical protein
MWLWLVVGSLSPPQTPSSGQPFLAEVLQVGFVEVTSFSVSNESALAELQTLTTLIGFCF